MCDDMFSDLVPVGSFNGLGLSYGMLKSVDGVIVSKGVGFKAEAVAIFLSSKPNFLGGIEKMCIFVNLFFDKMVD